MLRCKAALLDEETCMSDFSSDDPLFRSRQKLVYEQVRKLSSITVVALVLTLSLVLWTAVIWFGLHVARRVGFL